MTLTVLPAGPDDAAASIAVETAAYAGGPLEGVLFPGPFPSDTKGGNPRADKLAEELRNNPEASLLKVVDSDLGDDAGRIAFAKWYFRDENSEEFPPFELSPGSNPEACELLFGSIRAAYNKCWAGKRHAYLRLLHTHPDHQGRGAGAMLLKRLTTEADLRNVPCHLEATEVAKKLYEKFDFRESGRLVCDFSKWGGPKDHVVYIMLREANSSPSEKA